MTIKKNSVSFKNFCLIIVLKICCHIQDGDSQFSQLAETAENHVLVDNAKKKTYVESILDGYYINIREILCSQYFYNKF